MRDDKTRLKRLGIVAVRRQRSMFDREFIESLPEDRLGAAKALCEKFLRKCVKSLLFADKGGHGTDSLSQRRNGRSVETDRAVDPTAQGGRAPAQRRSARGGQCGPVSEPHRLFVATTAA